MQHNENGLLTLLTSNAVSYDKNGGIPDIYPIHLRPDIADYRLW